MPCAVPSIRGAVVNVMVDLHFLQFKGRRQRGTFADGLELAARPVPARFPSRAQEALFLIVSMNASMASAARLPAAIACTTLAPPPA